MGNGALKFKSYEIDRQANEVARLRVVGGIDMGSTFVMTAPKVTIGRGEDCEIILSDTKMSRRHAEIFQTPQGLFIRDLGSSNGVLINGQLIKQFLLKNGDKIGLGTSVLEIILAEAPTQIRSLSPFLTAKQVGTGSSGMTRFIQMPVSSPSANMRETEKKRKNFRLYISAGVLIGVLGLLPTAEKELKKRNKRYQPPSDISENNINLRRFLPQVGDSEMKKRADAYYKEGFREFMEKNYTRALSNFEVAIQVFPAHEMAKVYLNNVKKKMEEEVKGLTRLAKKDEEANRLKMAKQRYAEIQRMYFKEQNSKEYQEATTALEKIEKKIKDQEL